MGIYTTKMNLNLSGDSFVDEIHSDVGVSAFKLNHDWFIDDTGETLVIRDASGGGGNLLIEDTDYTISNQDTYLSTAATLNVYSTIQIINAAYQTGALYFSGKYVADSNDAEDVGVQTAAVSNSGTIGYDYNAVELCTTGTSGIRRTLPDATTCTNMKIVCIKVDSGIGALTLAPYTAQTISGMPYVFVTEQYQRVEIISDGTNWHIIGGILYWISGGQNTADWTNRELGFATVAYDGAVGTLLIGETVTEATSGITGVLIYNSGTALTLLKVTGVGYYTNDRVLTGGQSSATVVVNNASTTKDADQSCRHGTGFYANKFTVTLWISETATFSWTNARKAGEYDIDTGGGANRGYGLLSIDSDNVKIQTASAYVEAIAENGTIVLYSNQDYSFNVTLKVVF